MFADTRGICGMYTFRIHSLHFAGVERIQVVCSMNPATTVGRHPLAPRLAALLHVACMTYPPPPQLQTILSTLLSRTLDKAWLFFPLGCMLARGTCVFNTTGVGMMLPQRLCNHDQHCLHLNRSAAVWVTCIAEPACP